MQILTRRSSKFLFLFLIILLIWGASSFFLLRQTNVVRAANPGQAYNYAPASRSLTPVSVYRTTGNVTNATCLSGGACPAQITSNASSITFDYGKEVGGIVTLTFAGASDGAQQIGLAFSESSQFVGNISDASNGTNLGEPDGAIYTSGIAQAGTSSYTMPTNKLRGGFRYLTLFLNSSGWVKISASTLQFTASPTMATLNNYPNYFYSSDDLLNKIWYAGAYTVQMDTISPNQGRVWGVDPHGWDNSAVVGVGTTVQVDGAKRDRSVWPGDMGVAVPTAYVSTGDLLSVKNSLQTLYNHQNTTTGELPYAGPQFNFGGSDTYHMWTMSGTATYYLYSGDRAWLNSIWAQYKQAMNFITPKIDSKNLLNVTGTNDWGRPGQGGENTEANAILYHILTTGATLATVEGDSATATNYTNLANNIKVAANALLWDPTVGAFKDNSTSSTYPLDGNSLAIWFGLTDTTAKNKSILSYLENKWSVYGSLSPESNNIISPFIGSMELQAHFAAGDDQMGLNMMKTEWGYMLNSPLGTNSTFWEGYSADGSLNAELAQGFTSMSHGWSTGPTSALTFNVLGVQPTSALGQSYQVIPHPGNLSHVEGKLNMNGSQGVTVSYNQSACGNFSMAVDSTSLTGSVGVVGVPKFAFNHPIQINGTAVWDGTTFLGAAGIGSADQDASYVYFRNVQPGSRTFSYSDGHCAPPPSWTWCASENATCSFSGTHQVRYGANGTYKTLTVSGSTPCTNTAFGGDPTPGVVKQCSYDSSTPQPTWTACANEAATCSFTGTQEVRYGANGSYDYGVFTGSVVCNNNSFGDPIFNVAKQCWYAPVGSTTLKYEAESLTFTTSGPANTVSSDPAASGGSCMVFQSTAVGNVVTYTVQVPTAGTYDIRVGVKKYTNKGIFQFASNGVNHGTPQDTYAATASFPELDLGSVAFTTAGSKSFTFTITGKNAASSGYTLGIDYISLIQ